MSDACKDVVTTADGAPRIEFGNHGLRYWVGDDHRPSRRGYIAINHGLAAPHLFFKSGEFGALTTLNVASATVTFLSVFDNAEGGSFETPLSAFGERSERLEMPKRIGFAALAEKERLDDARALLTPAVLPLLTELAASFDVEVHDGWIFAYSLYGDVVTDDPAVWAWVFGVASRMLDVVELWDGPPAAAAFPLYTANRIERPAKLDGSLSRLKRSKK